MSTVGVGAAGYVGLAKETTSGTYVAPTQTVLLRNESLKYAEDRIQRRPLRGIADVSGLIKGFVHTEGDLQIEANPSDVVLFLKAARGAITKTGAGPYVYTFKPSAVAVPAATLSATVVRNGVAFGYTGLVVSSMQYTLDNGLLVATMSMMGQDEANQSVPAAAYNTYVPYGPGEYSIEVPTATPVVDTDTFTFAVNDNAEPQYRLKNPSRGAQFMKFGERSVELDLQRDFFNRTEYDNFKAATSTDITVTCSHSATESIGFHMPVSQVQSYDITGMSGQAELIRADIKYMGIFDTVTTQAYEIVVKTAANITIP